MASFTISEPLCFISNQYDKIDRKNLSVLVQDFYDLDELIASKKTLISECKQIGVINAISEFAKKRNNTKSADDVKEKVVKDILDIWDYVDLNHAGEFSTQFVALNTNRLPSGNSESLNVQHLTQSLNKVLELLSVHQNSIGLLSTNVTNIHRRLDVISVPPETSLHVNNVNDSFSRKRNLDPASPSFVPSKKTKSTSLVSSSKTPSSDRNLNSDSLPEVEAAATETTLFATTETTLSTTETTSLATTETTSLATTETTLSATTAETTLSATTAELALSAAAAETTLAAAAKNSSLPISPSQSLSVIESALAAAKVVAESSRSITDSLYLTEVDSSVSLSIYSLPPPPPLPQREGKSVRSPQIPPPPLSPLFVPPPSFADLTKDSKDNGGEWKTKGRKKDKRKTAATGTNSIACLKGVPPMSQQFAQFAVYRLQEQTTPDDVRKHLHKEGIEVKDVWMLGSIIKGTKTAKVRVAREHEKRAKNPSIWPIHCQIRDWNSDPKARKTKSLVSN